MEELEKKKPDTHNKKETDEMDFAQTQRGDSQSWTVIVEWEWRTVGQDFPIVIKHLYSATQRFRCAPDPGIVLPLRGVHPPRDHDAFSPLFHISTSIFEKFSDSEENFKNVTFYRKISWFSAAEISDDHKFRISPLFQYISLLFRQNYYSPLLWTIFPLLF